MNRAKGPNPVFGWKPGGSCRQPEGTKDMASADLITAMIPGTYDGSGPADRRLHRRTIKFLYAKKTAPQRAGA